MTKITLLESKKKPLPGKQDKTAVVCLGRFQCPHKGHELLVNAAKKAFRKGKYDAVIICIIDGKETRKDKTVNPLSAESREYYLKHATFTKGVKIVVAVNAFEAFIKCRELGYEPMCVVGGKSDDGEDRAETFKTLLDKYLKDDDGTPIVHKAISLERDPTSETAKGVSGTLVRAAVVNDKYEDFADMVSFDSELVTKKLFAELKNNIKED